MVVYWRLVTVWENNCYNGMLGLVREGDNNYDSGVCVGGVNGMKVVRKI